MGSLIEIRGLKQQFGSQVVLENVDLDILSGQILGILGPSGAGKTTLVKAIVGMTEPASGSINIMGVKMPSLSSVKNIGYMAQSDALYEDLNAIDNLLFFGELYGIKGKEARDRTMEVLEMVKLINDSKKPVKNFSGGMKRRLSLAAALFHKPKILILDEPTVGIDPVLRMEFWREFERIKSNGTAIIVTTHVMDEARHCQRLALLRNGGIIALGTPDELLAQSSTNNIEDAFLYFSGVKGGFHI